VAATVLHILKYRGKFHRMGNTVHLVGAENLDKAMVEIGIGTAIPMVLMTIASAWNQTLTPRRKEDRNEVVFPR
jgi:hypothetical protein